MSSVTIPTVQQMSKALWVSCRTNLPPFSGKLDGVNRFALNENNLGDPTAREVIIHIPQQGLAMIDEGHRLPVLIYLAPFTSSGLARAGWKAFAETLPQRHERLVNENKMLPTILVLPDCFTSLGGISLILKSGNWSWLSNH
ncbi:MAG: hypothetical protein CM15mP8_0090 [Methanobacteriota archaeon]|nr:MAG: hypothetical protein CM15mP8_0090 [Euryarchaeota archaeon]